MTDSVSAMPVFRGSVILNESAALIYELRKPTRPKGHAVQYFHGPNGTGNGPASAMNGPGKEDSHG